MRVHCKGEQQVKRWVLSRFVFRHESEEGSSPSDNSSIKSPPLKHRHLRALQAIVCEKETQVAAMKGNEPIYPKATTNMKNPGKQQEERLTAKKRAP
jgi:hypothetical protein